MPRIRKQMKRDLTILAMMCMLFCVAPETWGQQGNGGAGDDGKPFFTLKVDAYQCPSADAALFWMPGEQLWIPDITKDGCSTGAAGNYAFRVKPGFSGLLTLAPIETIDPDDGTVSLGWNIWSQDPMLINSQLRDASNPVHGYDGDLQELTYQIETPKLEIVSPEEQADYDVSEEDYTTTPLIPFRAKVSPDEFSQQLSSINWTLKLEYDTTISRGPWTSQRTFQTQHDMTHYETYSSEGGKVNVNAEASLDSVLLSANQDITVTGVPIPDGVITARLINLYNGATPNLLTGIAAVESGIDCYCQFYSISKYGVTDLWPRESYDGGSHIGLMQVPVTMQDAWNWLTNTQTAVDNHFNPALGRSHTKVNEIRTQYPELPELTEIQHENNALSIYRMGWSYPQHFYYVPNTDHSDWVVNPNNPTGVGYADDVRENLR